MLQVYSLRMDNYIKILKQRLCFTILLSSATVSNNVFQSKLFLFSFIFSDFDFIFISIKFDFV